MNQRTRRASEAVDTHAMYLENQVEGTAVARIEQSLLDPAIDPGDVRYGHEEFLYGPWGGNFTKMMQSITNSAMTFAITTDLMTEVKLTVEMMEEEGIDWLPMLPHMLPAQTGLVLFPFGIENTFFDHAPDLIKMKRGSEYFNADIGGGDRWFMDGFLWTISDRVSKDGHAGTPSDGLMIYPLTRWRGRNNDRPFRGFLASHPEFGAPELVASDLTAWAFDEPGEVEWISPEVVYDANTHTTIPYDDNSTKETVLDDLVRNRWWIRSIVWSTFRWMTDEIWIPESAHRASKRRMTRARPLIHDNPPHEDGEVAIVDLRLERREYIAREGESEPPWWRTRWTVRGHWAKRRYAIRDKGGNSVGAVRGSGAVEGETFYYKRVYIEPFAKGPEWAPLILKDKVGVLDR